MTVNSPPQLTTEQAQRFVVDTSPWMSCDDCFDHLDEYVECSPTTQFEWSHAMSAHISGCQACREEAESLLVLLDEDI